VNVYPREIEECLLGHDDIVDCAVLGVPDDEWGEILYAIVQPTPDAALDEDGVVAYVREHMADYKRPRVVELRRAASRPQREGAQAQAPGGLPGPSGRRLNSSASRQPVANDNDCR